MMTLIITLHVIICALLIIIILIQAGRGGGLVENLSSMESVFGPKTNAFLTRTTSVLAILFFLTCLSLAVFSARAGRSLMKDAKIKPAAKPETETASQVIKVTTPPAGATGDAAKPKIEVIKEPASPAAAGQKSAPQTEQIIKVTTPPAGATGEAAKPKVEVINVPVQGENKNKPQAP